MIQKPLIRAVPYTQNIVFYATVIYLTVTACLEKVFPHLRLISPGSTQSSPGLRLIHSGVS